MIVRTQTSVSLLLGGVPPHVVRALEFWMSFPFHRVLGLFADEASEAWRMSPS